MPFKCKNSHNYSFNSSVVRNVSRETMDENGRIGFEKESVCYTDPKYVQTPKCSVMDLEVLLNSGQKVKRVNTAVLSDTDSLAYAPDFVSTSEPPKDKDKDE